MKLPVDVLAELGAAFDIFAYYSLRVIKANFHLMPHCPQTVALTCVGPPPALKNVLLLLHVPVQVQR